MGELPQQIRAKLESIRQGVRQRMDEYEANKEAIHAAEAEIKRQFSEERRTRFPAHLAACGAPKAIVDVFRGTLDATPVLTVVSDWLKTDKPTCLLLGTNGLGKSVAAAYALRIATRKVFTSAHRLGEPVEVEALDAGAGMFLTAAGLRFASRFSDGKALSVLERAATVRILALDELRGEDFKGVGLERLEEVLSERDARRLRTVLTANLGLQELEERLGARIASRYSQGAVVFEANGKDRRKQ